MLGLPRPLWMRWVFVVLAAAAPTACAHGPGGGLSAEAVESAYLQARLPSAACRSNDPACCGERIRAGRAAETDGHTAMSASQWQEVVLACPGHRAEAAAALSSMRPPPALEAATPGAIARVLNVAFRTRLSPAVRLYWVSAAVGARLLPTADSKPSATQSVEVEVQAIHFDGGRAGPLMRIERRFDLALDPESIVTLEIAERPGSGAAPPELEIRPQVERRPTARPRPQAAPATRGPPPILERARPRHLDPFRRPLEFGPDLRGVRPSVRLCLDQEGRFETLRFLEPTHPRLAASIIDMFRDSRHDPYRVNDHPVPSCEATRPS